MILLAVNSEMSVIKSQDVLHKCKRMFFWLLLTDKRLNRQNKIIWVTLPFLVPARGTSVLQHPETMLITGSVYDLADIVPYFQTDRAHNLCQIHFTVQSGVLQQVLQLLQRKG